METKFEFNTQERIELLDRQLDLLKQESDFLKNNKSSDDRQFFADQHRIIAIGLEILAKEEYLIKLKDSIKMDKDQTEKEFAELDIDRLLLSVEKNRHKLNIHDRNQLDYLRAELTAWLDDGNKEPIVFYATGMKEILNKVK